MLYDAGYSQALCDDYRHGAQKILQQARDADLATARHLIALARLEAIADPADAALRLGGILLQDNATLADAVNKIRSTEDLLTADAGFLLGVHDPRVLTSLAQYLMATGDVECAKALLEKNRRYDPISRLIAARLDGVNQSDAIQLLAAAHNLADRRIRRFVRAEQKWIKFKKNPDPNPLNQESIGALEDFGAVAAVWFRLFDPLTMSAAKPNLELLAQLLRTTIALTPCMDLVDGDAAAGTEIKVKLNDREVGIKLVPNCERLAQIQKARLIHEAAAARHRPSMPTCQHSGCPALRWPAIYISSSGDIPASPHNPPSTWLGSSSFVG